MNHASEPHFPPAFAGRLVASGDDPFVAAQQGAADGVLGAGDLLWSDGVARARCALVLEPETDAAHALQMAPLAMVAFGDAIGAIGPPNLAITYRWPFDLLANGAFVGRIRAAMPPDYAEDAVPDWLVVGLDIALMRTDDEIEPGADTARTALHEEGAGDIDSTTLIEAYARHFLSWLDRWQSDGFAGIGEMWQFRAADRKGRASAMKGGRTIEGTMLGIDPRGSLVIEIAGAPVAVSLVDAFLQEIGTPE